MASKKHLDKLKGSRILIFGATSGIGFALAEASLDYGANIIISGSKQAKLDNTVTRLLAAQDSGNDKSTLVRAHVCDLSNCSTMENNLTTLMEAVTNRGVDKLNHIVFTAGDALKLVPLSGMTPEHIQAAGNVRFIAPLMIAKLVSKYMVISPESSFTITSGVNGTKPNPGWALVAGYSAGQEGLARGLAVDLAPIRVNAVSPGSVKTELFDGLSAEAIEGMRKATLTGRLGRPEDLAESYLYAMRDRFLTGSTIHSHGGRLLV